MRDQKVEFEISATFFSDFFEKIPAQMKNPSVLPGYEHLIFDRALADKSRFRAKIFYGSS